MKVHMRRGYYRSLKSGKVVYVPPHCVGGNFLFDDLEVYDPDKEQQRRTIDDEWRPSKFDFTTEVR